jgi:hypothetical protein
MPFAVRITTSVKLAHERRGWNQSTGSMRSRASGVSWNKIRSLRYSFVGVLDFCANDGIDDGQVLMALEDSSAKGWTNQSWVTRSSVSKVSSILSRALESPKGWLWNL